MRKIVLVIFSCFLFCFAKAEDGYRLWLRYDKIHDPVLLQQYRKQIGSVFFTGSSPTLSVAKSELLNGLGGLLGGKITEQKAISNGTIIIGNINSSFFDEYYKDDDVSIRREGFTIHSA